MASTSHEIELSKLTDTPSEIRETPVPSPTNTQRKVPRRNQGHDDYNKKLSQFSFRNEYKILFIVTEKSQILTFLFFFNYVIFNCLQYAL